VITNGSYIKLLIKINMINVFVNFFTRFCQNIVWRFNNAMHELQLEGMGNEANETGSTLKKAQKQ
jgi:hypothetical protein